MAVKMGNPHLVKYLRMREFEGTRMERANPSVSIHFHLWKLHLYILEYVRWAIMTLSTIWDWAHTYF